MADHIIGSKTLRFVGVILLLTFAQACSSGSSQQDIAIIQAELNKNPALQPIPNGTFCSSYPPNNPASADYLYKDVQHIHIQPMGSEPVLGKVSMYCSYFTWDSETGVEQAPPAKKEGLPVDTTMARIGKYVVDAIVSEEEINGERIAKFNARFEPNELGKSLAVPGLRPPPDPLRTNMEAVISKNSDGVLVAQISSE